MIDIQKEIEKVDKMIAEQRANDIKYYNKYICNAWRRKMKGVNLRRKTIENMRRAKEIYGDELSGSAKYCLNDLLIF